MNYFPFKNYEEFKELFGIQVHGNGEKSRRNKILLAWLKQPWVLKEASEGYREAINIRSMSELRLYIKGRLENEGYMMKYREGAYAIRLNNWRMYSKLYYLDEQDGVCEDSDTRSVRYVNNDNGRVFKMKAGKFLKNVINETEWGRGLCEQAVLWICEEFSEEWRTYVSGRIPNYHLVVDDDFYEIYNGRGNCCEGMHSCMDGGDHASFYNDAVKAKAASLRDDDGRILARCVVFTEVRDEETGEILRLAERQYSRNLDNVLKRILVDQLIAGGYIDGYKKVGADCHNCHAFVSNSGEDWYEKEFSIECNLDNGDTLSYQDSFKAYNMDERRAYNFEADSDEDYYDLADTSDYFRGVRNYDSWNDEYTDDDIVTVYYHGREYTCSEDRLDEFRWIESRQEYWHEDDIVYCYDIDDYELHDDAYYSDLLEEYYKSESRMWDDEQDYKADNWYWSEYDCEYFEDEDDVVEMIRKDGSRITISRDSLECIEYYMKDGEYHEGHAPEEDKED